MGSRLPNDLPRRGTGGCWALGAAQKPFSKPRVQLQIHLSYYYWWNGRKKLRLEMCPFSALDHEFDNDRLDCCESLQAVRETIRVWGNWGYSTLADVCSNWRDSTGGTSGTSVLVVLFNGIVLAPLRSAHLFFLFTCFCVTKVLSDAIIHMLTPNFKPWFFLQMTSHCMHLSIIAIHLYNLPLM